MWSSKSRRQLPTQRSATPFCHGLRKAVRVGSLPRWRGCCACRASNCRRRARFSRTRSSRERKTLNNQPRKCRSDTIMARILAEKSESSFSPSHSFSRCTTFCEAQPSICLASRTPTERLLIRNFRFGPLARTSFAYTTAQECRAIANHEMLASYAKETSSRSMWFPTWIYALPERMRRKPAFTCLFSVSMAMLA
jgi:hypothetical protein